MNIFLVLYDMKQSTLRALECIVTRSRLDFKHAAVLVKGSKILSIAFNDVNCHAEARLLRSKKIRINQGQKPAQDYCY